MHDLLIHSMKIVHEKRQKLNDNIYCCNCLLHHGDRDVSQVVILTVNFDPNGLQSGITQISTVQQVQLKLTVQLE